jgi:predicted peptidase
MKVKKIFTVLAGVLLGAFGAVGFAACGDDSGKDAVDSSINKGGWNDFTWEYNDASSTATELKCSVYVPTTYDGTTAFPLITYIPDATISQASKTKSAQCPKNWKGYDNALILVLTSDNLGENPADTTTQGGQVVPIINDLVTKYKINENKLYLTGQSKGGIFDFALNDAFPDKFAATVYVGCQMGGELYNSQYNSILANEKFKNQKFVYICSGKDPKAPTGQADVKAVLNRENKTYGELNGLDYKSISSENARVKAVLDQGYTQNFFQFTQVTASGTDGDAQEHMQSFEYCYEFEAIYNWLLAQSK